MRPSQRTAADHSEWANDVGWRRVRTSNSIRVPIMLMFLFYRWVTVALAFAVSVLSPAITLFRTWAIRYADYVSSINQSSRLILNMLQSAVGSKSTLGHTQRSRGGSDGGQGPALTSHVELDYELDVMSVDDTCRPWQNGER